ncbi:MAG TPA: hypothetical protein DGR97_01905 [Gammaproteobacteria bacterium]|nr:hypothetical protein [Gammaproteobacteria bacterium]
MNLAGKLNGIRDAASKRIPTEKLSIMHRRTEELRASGIMDHVISPGDQLPPFALPNQNSKIVNSTDLLSSGALVITVFRGHW